MHADQRHHLTSRACTRQVPERILPISMAVGDLIPSKEPQKISSGPSNWPLLPISGQYGHSIVSCFAQKVPPKKHVTMLPYHCDFLSLNDIF